MHGSLSSQTIPWQVNPNNEDVEGCSDGLRCSNETVAVVEGETEREGDGDTDIVGVRLGVTVRVDVGE